MYCQYTYNMVGVIKVKTEVLRMLKETDDYLSGQEICERLNVSRTAVWKVIKQLEAEGYEIEAVRNRGYRLRFLGDVLSQAELESSIDSEWAGKNILYFDETDSIQYRDQESGGERCPARYAGSRGLSVDGKGTPRKKLGGAAWRRHLDEPASAPGASSDLRVDADAGGGSGSCRRDSGGL